jgi:hypothetical protein
MAHISPNNIITINRGDTFGYTFYINLGTKMHPILHTLEEGEKLYLGVSEANFQFENAIIKKVFTSADADSEGVIYIEFASTDTLNLLPGNYYYSIKLSQPIPDTSEIVGLEKVTTLVPRTKFVIIE